MANASSIWGQRLRPAWTKNTEHERMSDLDRMISEVREWRRYHLVRKARIEAAACAIRECALLQARAAVLGRVEPGFEFRNAVPGGWVQGAAGAYRQAQPIYGGVSPCPRRIGIDG